MTPTHVREGVYSSADLNADLSQKTLTEAARTLSGQILAIQAKLTGHVRKRAGRCVLKQPWPQPARVDAGVTAGQRRGALGGLSRVSVGSVRWDHFAPSNPRR